MKAGVYNRVGDFGMLMGIGAGLGAGLGVGLRVWAALVVGSGGVAISADSGFGMAISAPSGSTD